MTGLERIARTLGMLGAALRGDGWENLWTGLGTARDRTTATTYQAVTPITDPELSALYHGDDIAGRVVNIIPREMLREGFGVTCSDTAAAGKVAARMKALDAITNVQNAAIWGRLFGGSVILVGADDGQDPRIPLFEDGIRTLSFLQVYDKRQVWPHEWDTDPRSPYFNEPRIYRLTNLRTSSVSFVHASRVIRFGGAHTAEQERVNMQGWDYSVLQAAYDPIRQFGTTYKNAEYLLGDSVQGVFKMRGLLSMIAGGQLADLQTRAQFLDMTRGIMRAVMLDADGGESFEKVQTTFSGVGDMLDRAANRLSAATEIPVTILMGQSPAGLNATGASDIRAWYDRVQGDRARHLKPKLERLIYLIAKAERLGDRDFDILFRPLWQETPKEKADRQKVEADTAAVWISNEVLTPEEVAIAEFGSAERQPYRIDPRTRTVDLSVPAKDVPGSGVPAKTPPPKV